MPTPNAPSRLAKSPDSLCVREPSRFAAHNYPTAKRRVPDPGNAENHPRRLRPVHEPGLRNGALSTLSEHPFQFSRGRAETRPQNARAGPSASRVGEESFEDSGLASLVVPQKTREIGKRAFHGSFRLRSLKFAENAQLKIIRAGAFGWTGIGSFRAQETLRRIGPEAFCRCSSLREVVLNEDLEALGAYSTEHVENYSENDSDVTKDFVDGDVFEGSALESVKLPRTLRTLGSRTFYACERLTVVMLPEALENVGVRCFAESGLQRRRFSEARRLKVLRRPKVSDTGLYVKHSAVVLSAFSCNTVGSDAESAYLTKQYFVNRTQG